MAVEHKSFPLVMSLAVHELRTPMTVVTGYLRMLLKEQAGPISEQQRRFLELAEHSCNRVIALVKEMSELGKLEAGELGLARQSFDLAALLAELANGMHEARGVRLEVRGTDRPVEVVGDRARVETALAALLNAVIRERGAPGVIVAECSTIEGAQPAGMVAVGQETTVQELAQAAETGMLVHEWKHGTGFAIPIARRVVEAAGGTVWSAPGDHEPARGDDPGQPRSGLALRLPLKNS